MRLTVCSLLVIGAFFSQKSTCMTVNKLNGGASVVYVDFAIPGPVIPMELPRTYNSITAVSPSSGWNGAFGWGWTSPFETSITVTPERNVLLRDGVTGNTLVFHPEKEDPAIRETFLMNMRRAYFEQKLGRKITESELKKMQLPDKMQSRLKSDPQFRLELAAKYGITGNIPRGEVLVSSEYGYQTLQFVDGQWLRDRDGITQVFDKEGRLVRQKDKNGYYFDYSYSPTEKLQIREISNQDRSTTLKFSWRQNRISEIADNRNRRSRYTYDAQGNLTQVADSKNQIYIYKYENKKLPHLLTKVEYPNEGSPSKRIYREIRYDDKGLVTYHREKDGSETEYQYGKKPNDPENQFWTKTTKKGASSSEELDEYQIKARPDGSRYLYKQETKNASGTMITVFAPCCAKPIQITKNGETTNFKYFENGLLQERVSPKEDLRVEYDPRFKKVSKVNQNGLISTYEYDSRGNLIKASNTKAESVGLRYDRFGRIQQMTNTQGRQITFKYGDLGKPVLITERNIGSIRVQYDSSGRVSKTETVVSNNRGRKPSEAQSQEVVRKIMGGFQQLLDILRPAGVSLSQGTT